MPKTLDEMKAALDRKLRREWFAGLKVAERDFWAFYENGVPLEWAETVAEEVPEIPVSAWPKIIHPPRVLTRALTSVNTDEMTNFDDVVRKKFGSNAKLAAALDISPALLSRARTKGPKGRAIRKSIADKIQELTGWPAKPSHWPNGFVERKD